MSIRGTSDGDGAGRFGDGIVGFGGCVGRVGGGIFFDRGVGLDIRGILLEVVVDRRCRAFHRCCRRRCCWDWVAYWQREERRDCERRRR